MSADLTTYTVELPGGMDHDHGTDYLTAKDEAERAGGRVVANEHVLTDRHTVDDFTE